MADKVEQAGSWAKNDVFNVLQTNGVLPSHPSDALET